MLPQELNGAHAAQTAIMSDHSAKRFFLIVENVFDVIVYDVGKGVFVHCICVYVVLWPIYVYKG